MYGRPHYDHGLNLQRFCCGQLLRRRGPRVAFPLHFYRPRTLRALPLLDHIPAFRLPVFYQLLVHYICTLYSGGCGSLTILRPPPSNPDPLSFWIHLDFSLFDIVQATLAAWAVSISGPFLYPFLRSPYLPYSRSWLPWGVRRHLFLQRSFCLFRYGPWSGRWQMFFLLGSAYDPGKHVFRLDRGGSSLHL